MQVIAKKLGASMATMTVKNGEEGRLFDARCQRLVRLRARLLEVKHDRYSILVVVPRSAVVRVRCV